MDLAFMVDIVNQITTTMACQAWEEQAGIPQ
jgi:hypothetical protein